VSNWYAQLILVSDAEMRSLGLSYSNRRHVKLITSASLLFEANCNEGFTNPTHSSVTLSCLRLDIDYLTNKFLTLRNRNVHHQQTKARHRTSSRNTFNFSCLHSQSKEPPVGSSCSVEGYVNPKNYAGNNGCRQQNSFNKSDSYYYLCFAFSFAVYNNNNNTSYLQNKLLLLMVIVHIISYLWLHSPCGPELPHFRGFAIILRHMFQL
jgi:hypothetical protein